MARQGIAIRGRETADAVHLEFQLRHGIVGDGIWIAGCRVANHGRQARRFIGTLDALQQADYVIILIEITIAFQTNFTARHVQLHAPERFQGFERGQLLLNNYFGLRFRHIGHRLGDGLHGRSGFRDDMPEQSMHLQRATSDKVHRALVTLFDQRLVEV